MEGGNEQRVGNPASDRSEEKALECGDLRLRRIRDYLGEALAKDNALDANLGAINSNLMAMAYQLANAIEGAMPEGAGALEEFRNLLPAMDSFLRLTKQIDRFAQLALRFAASREAVNQNNNRIPSKS